MVFEKKHSYKYPLAAVLLFALIQIAFLPIWLVVIILYTAHMIFWSRKLGVSATALSPMSMRWLQHQLGLRRDEACAKLIKVLPNHCYAGLRAAALPVLLGHRAGRFSEFVASTRYMLQRFVHARQRWLAELNKTNGQLNRTVMQLSRRLDRSMGSPTETC